MIIKGTKITCPECESDQLEATEEIPVGGQMKDAKWSSLGFDMDSREMSCHKCGVLWTRRNPLNHATQIHTDKGWVYTSKEKPKTLVVPKSE